MLDRIGLLFAASNVWYFFIPIFNFKKIKLSFCMETKIHIQYKKMRKDLKRKVEIIWPNSKFNILSNYRYFFLLLK